MLNSKTTALKKKAGAFKSKIIDVASDVLSAKNRLASKRKEQKYNVMADTIRGARAYDNAPDFDNKGKVTDAYKTRFMADVYKDELRKERNKK